MRPESIESLTILNLSKSDSIECELKLALDSSSHVTLDDDEEDDDDGLSDDDRMAVIDLAALANGLLLFIIDCFDFNVDD